MGRALFFAIPLGCALWLAIAVLAQGIYAARHCPPGVCDVEEPRP